MGSKKHKKHKSEKRDKYEDKQFGIEKPGLKLILKVGSSSTPEHSSDSPGPPVLPAQSNINYSVSAMGDEESRQSLMSLHSKEDSHGDRQHKKAKKKKKKKDKDKDRDKHEKKHKHHHKEKRKRFREESSQDDISMGEESLSDPPLPKRMMDCNSSSMKNNTESNHNSTGAASDTHHHAAGQACTPPCSITREPRSCVLRQRQERTALQRLLDHLLKNLEKRDPQQFFAWPVTDHIAPGYSQIIQQPMDFSTMKQKIDDNQYPTLGDFTEDFKLMCNNAMIYNHPETIYYKAAKKLLHVGLKIMSPEKLKPLRSVVTYMYEISREELGFDLGYEDAGFNSAGVKTESGEEQVGGDDTEDTLETSDSKKKIREGNRPLSKFEAIPDDLTPEEILEQAQKAAAAAAERLSLRHPPPQMGFLRQRKDGTTSLAILVPNDGVIPGTNERPVSLGLLCGKLTHGTGQLQGFREDRRNVAKTVKPLYYGAFGSYAPSYDSTFANLTKEETDLVYQTYGDETAVHYAESILDFTKDCDYTMTMVDDLLDLLTGYEHRKTKQFLEERRQLREEEERIRQILEGKPAQPSQPPPAQPSEQDVNIDMNSLKSLSDLGIDTSFLDQLENQMKATEEREAMQTRLDQTSNLIQKLQQVQNDRLSLPPPQHLAHISPPSENEVQLAEKITESLKDMVKKVQPHDVASVAAIRKAMGVHPASESNSPNPITEENPTSVASEAIGEEVDVVGPSSQSAVEMERDEEPVSNATGHDVPDLESELREFLESEPALSNSPLHDDKTIEEILSVS